MAQEDQRVKRVDTALRQWLRDSGYADDFRPIAGDASARRYYRDGRGRLVMDASALDGCVASFVDTAKRLEEAGVRVPRIDAYDTDAGYMVLEDVGTTHLIDRLRDDGRLYEQALDLLVRIQTARSEGLPPYDAAFLRFEMDLMPQWYLAKFLQKEPDASLRQALDRVFGRIVDEVTAQPSDVFVHRDYHSRNLLLDDRGEPVPIDFQDARRGMITYDAVSLLKDVYVPLDAERIERLALAFRDRVSPDTDDATFMRWFDFTGLQRHIKILGIFARLALRDGKEGYVRHIPLTRRYIIEVCRRYEGLEVLASIVGEEA